MRLHDWNRREAVLGLAAGLAGCAAAPPAPPRSELGAGRWRKLPTMPFKGKQDDVVFADAQRGWYVNGSGKIYVTQDGGESWTEQLSRPGTYFRCIGAVNRERLFAGNIGTDYFPGVTDTTPLYRSDDGGGSWQAVAVPGPAVKGLCAIDVTEREFIDAGVLRRRTLVHAGGRVGSPAFLMRSLDGGESFRTLDLNAHIAMITDLKFFDEANGLVVGGSDPEVEQSNARILRTQDGGTTWVEAWRSKRPYELIWKISFVSRQLGFASVQSYDPKATQRYIARTRDGGRHWEELPLVDEGPVREFGIGFVNEREGWVGTSTGGFETRDGGQTWSKVEMGRAVNKIRILRDAQGRLQAAYAIGVELWKFEPSA